MMIKLKYYRHENDKLSKYLSIIEIIIISVQKRHFTNNHKNHQLFILLTSQHSSELSNEYTQRENR